jgi:hypothetical protein
MVKKMWEYKQLSEKSTPMVMQEVSVTYTIKYKKFWEELIAYFPSIPHEPHRKRRL